DPLPGDAPLLRLARHDPTGDGDTDHPRDRGQDDRQDEDATQHPGLDQSGQQERGGQRETSEDEEPRTDSFGMAVEVSVAAQALVEAILHLAEYRVELGLQLAHEHRGPAFEKLVVESTLVRLEVAGVLESSEPVIRLREEPSPRGHLGDLDVA